MRSFRADFHIHTVLSPCADLQMSPSKIVEKALQTGISIIGIADHNSTLQCKEVAKIAERHGITVLKGVEITTREEVHLLAFFQHDAELDEFQQFIETHILKIPNKPEKSGYQVMVDEAENIVAELPYMLSLALQISINEIVEKVKSLSGIVIPAHIDRPRFSIYSQLGFWDNSIIADAVEISANCNLESFENKHPEVKEFTKVRGSDAHYLNQIGEHYTELLLEKNSFDEVLMALHQQNGRCVVGFF